jgi:hypothetical protein
MEPSKDNSTNGSISADTKANVVRSLMKAHPNASNQDLQKLLAIRGVETTTSYISKVRQRSSKSAKAGRANKDKKPNKIASKRSIGQLAKYPRHTARQALRIPQAILEQNAGRECSDKEAATFAGIGYGGPVAVEISSAIKYGFLERPGAQRVRVTDLAKQILRPQRSNDEIEGLRQAVLQAPLISEVYNHYRGENLPDTKFFDNALTDTFRLPSEKVVEFKEILHDSLKQAGLIEEHGGRVRILDVSHQIDGAPDSDGQRIVPEKVSKSASGETCFVMMPFADPLGSYYEKIYVPAIKKAKLIPLRADADIFGTGKIIDQIWQGINSASVLVAELTTRNPNVFYELGLAHALNKPVVLVSRGEDDVPFDLQHIRVIYYDVNDPFWGEKLVDKISENILSAIRNPEEALFRRALSIPS